MGEPPSIEVTICQLNDNIDKQFLKDMVQKFGIIEELFIYYHPVSNKHLGLGRAVFETVKAAKACVEKLNNTSVMGKMLQVFLDPFGEKCKKIFEEAIAEKKPQPQPAPVEEKKTVSEVDTKKKEEEVVAAKEKEIEKKKDREREELRLKDKERERLVDRYSRGYVHARSEFATPSGSDLGYATAPSEYSASYGSAGTTPLQ